MTSDRNMKAKHTPGEWIAANIDAQGWTIVAGDTIVATVGGGNNGEDYDPAYEADARLLAAAPDMLDALGSALIALDAMATEIEKLPAATFGTDSIGDGTVPGGMVSWPLRDEFLHYIKRDADKARAALAKAGAAPDALKIASTLSPQERIAKLEKALRKIAELRFAEDANEPFDEALDIADAAIRATLTEGAKP